MAPGLLRKACFHAVFAESEIVSLMGQGTPREDIACGAVGSVVAKVAVQVARKAADDAYFLTGGFCNSAMMLRKLLRDRKSVV